MTRRRWEAGLSRPAVAGLVVQGVVTAALLGLTALLLRSHGWFSSAHDRALLWDDVTVFTGLLCGVPVLAFLNRRRSAALGAAVVIAGAAFLVLLILRPAAG